MSRQSSGCTNFASAHDEEDRETTNGPCCRHCQGFEAASLSAGCDAAVRAMVCGLFAQSSGSRRDDGRARHRRRPFDRASVGDQTGKLVPLFEKTFRKHKRPVGKSWRMDETYIKVKGSWKYLYRAVDKAGNTVDFLLRARRDKAAARRFFEKTIAKEGHTGTG